MSRAPTGVGNVRVGVTESIEQQGQQSIRARRQSNQAAQIRQFVASLGQAAVGTLQTVAASRIQQDTDAAFEAQAKGLRRPVFRTKKVADQYDAGDATTTALALNPSEVDIQPGESIGDALARFTAERYGEMTDVWKANFVKHAQRSVVNHHTNLMQTEQKNLGNEMLQQQIGITIATVPTEGVTPQVISGWETAIEVARAANIKEDVISQAGVDAAEALATRGDVNGVTELAKIFGGRRVADFDRIAQDAKATKLFQDNAESIRLAETLDDLSVVNKRTTDLAGSDDLPEGTKLRLDSLADAKEGEIRAALAQPTKDLVSQFAIGNSDMSRSQIEAQLRADVDSGNMTPDDARKEFNKLGGSDVKLRNKATINAKLTGQSSQPLSSRLDADFMEIMDSTNGSNIPGRVDTMTKAERVPKQEQERIELNIMAQDATAVGGALLEYGLLRTSFPAGADAVLSGMDETAAIRVMAFDTIAERDGLDMTNPNVVQAHAATFAQTAQNLELPAIRDQEIINFNWGVWFPGIDPGAKDAQGNIPFTTANSQLRAIVIQEMNRRTGNAVAVGNVRLGDASVSSDILDNMFKYFKSFTALEYPAQLAADKSRDMALRVAYRGLRPVTFGNFVYDLGGGPEVSPSFGNTLQNSLIAELDAAGWADPTGSARDFAPRWVPTEGAYGFIGSKGVNIGLPLTLTEAGKTRPVVVEANDTTGEGFKKVDLTPLTEIIEPTNITGQPATRPLTKEIARQIFQEMGTVEAARARARELGYVWGEE